MGTRPKAPAKRRVVTPDRIQYPCQTEGCANTVSRKTFKRCRACWQQRGPDGSVLPKKICYVCQEREVSSGSKKGMCRFCYDTQRSDVTSGRGPISDQPRVIPQSYEEAIALFRGFIGCARPDYKGPAKAGTNSIKRIAVLSDLHCPFQHNEAFAAFLEREKGADLCILGGDLQDHYSISRFLKYESVPIQAELAAAQMVLEKLSETFPHVVCVSGNHDSPRFEKLLVDRLPLEAVDIIRYLSGGTLSTIDAMARQFPNVEVVSNKIDGRYSASWYYQHGDLIVTHAEKFSRVPGAALRSVEDWLLDFEGALGLKPWRVCSQAHTHQLGWFPFRADKLLIESGCMCHHHGYQFTAKIGGRPQRLGWVSLEMRDGVTDLSSVRPYWYRERKAA